MGGTASPLQPARSSGYLANSSGSPKSIGRGDTAGGSLTLSIGAGATKPVSADLSQARRQRSPQRARVLEVETVSTPSLAKTLASAAATIEVVPPVGAAASSSLGSATIPSSVGGSPSVPASML